MLDGNVPQHKVEQEGARNKEGRCIFIRSYSFCFPMASWNQGRTDPHRNDMLWHRQWRIFCLKWGILPVCRWNARYLKKKGESYVSFFNSFCLGREASFGAR